MPVAARVERRTVAEEVEQLADPVVGLVRVPEVLRRSGPRSGCDVHAARG